MSCMMQSYIVQCAIDEVEKRSWAMTQQFFEVHELIYINNVPKIEWVEIDEDEGTAIVYFAVKENSFYLAVYLHIKPEISLKWISTEEFVKVWFCAKSETFTCDELSSMTTLRTTHKMDKGEKFGNGKFTSNLNSIDFEPNTEPGKFEEKLMKLLDFLERDIIGVKNLVDNADGHIQSTIVFHIGNSNFTGLVMSKHIYQRLAALNLEIVFDIYAQGKYWK